LRQHVILFNYQNLLRLGEENTVDELFLLLSIYYYM